IATATVAEGATRKLYLTLHRWMCMAKALDDRMHILVKQGRAPFVGSSRGHEGIQVASTAAIGPDDWLVPHYRGLANAIVRGLTMREWMLAVFAKAGDPLSAGRNSPGGCYSYHRLKIAPVSQVVASWVPKASGIAYAAKLKGEGSVTLCTFGDGATSQGDFHEGVNFAAVHRLPVVFVCENNSYAISVPIRLQMANPNVADRAAGYGIAGATGDGTDVPACFEACRDAAGRARRREGPTLIDAKSWRINAHTSEDNHPTYRPREEAAEALPAPLEREKGDPDWTRPEGSPNGGAKKAPEWAQTGPTSPGDAIEDVEPSAPKAEAAVESEPVTEAPPETEETEDEWP